MISDALNSNRYRLVLVRHGESVGNALGYYQGQADFESSERSRAQALAEQWECEQVSFDTVINSQPAG